jgi:phage-related protein
MKYNPQKDLELKKRAVDVFTRELNLFLKKRMEKGTKSHRNDWRYTNLDKEAIEEIFDFLNYFFVLKKLLWREDKKRPKRVCFDFDGVVVKKYKKYTPFKFEKINQKIAKLIRKLYRKYQIVIFTARQSEELPEIAKFLKKNKVPFDRITNEKVPALIYVDDRAFRFVSDKQIPEIEKAIKQEERGWVDEVRKDYRAV